MPEVEIRPIQNSDMPGLLGIELAYSSSRVWQMDRVSGEGALGATFREARLPREAHLEYPRSAAQIFSELQDPQLLILTALIDAQPVGYIRISTQISPKTAWVQDLAVKEKYRRKGIGVALLLAGQDWSIQQGLRRMVVETQSKNFPAIQLLRKLGFDFSGFNDQFYSNQDIALLFSRSLK
jgi:ribosomal protein S18 acetylase RimI-like enzyme